MQLNDLSDDIDHVSAPVGLVNVPYRPGVYRNFFKRVFDVSAVVLSGVIVVPLTLLIALLVIIDGHKPFYMSDRVGRNGLTCRMLKLPTIVQNADDLPNDPQAHAAGCFVDTPIGDGTNAPMVASPIDFGDPGWAPALASPEFGEHTELVLLDLGYDWDRIIELKERKAIL